MLLTLEQAKDSRDALAKAIKDEIQGQVPIFGCIQITSRWGN